MRLWADVYSPDGETRLGSGPLTTLQTASVTRVLDGVGSVQFMYPATDPRALSLMQNKRQVRLWSEINDVTRELGRGVIETIGLDVAEGGYVVNAGGPDTLTFLTHYSALLGRIYDNQTLETIVDDLADLAGWTATVDGGLGNLSARFDGSNVLKCLLMVAEQQGLHLRAGEDAETIEFGAFGETLEDDYGRRVVLYGPSQTGLREMQTRDNLIFIESFSEVKQSESIANWVIPLGAGEGEAALTLEHSTRTSPYTIQSMAGPDGRTLYYLSDATSVAAYGQIQSPPLVFKNIGPITTSATDIERAANALYDAAAAWLERNAVLLTSYSFSCRKPAITVRPGDKIRVTYMGIVETETGLLTFVDIDDDFWVMRVGESMGPDGIRLQLEVASIDRVERSAEEIIVGALEAITISNTAIQSYYTKDSNTYWRTIDDTHSAQVSIYVTNATQAIDRVMVRFNTRPFRSTSQGAAAGGDHRHKMFDWQIAQSTPPSAYYQEFFAKREEAGTNDVNVWLAISGATKNYDLWTFESSGDHTHDPVYGIEDDSEYPDTVRIKVNGVDRTSALGGPWGVGGGAITVEVNITEYILAESTLHKVHTVTFECDDGQGEIEAMIEVYEIIQTVGAA